ncbi:MAG: riboflavin synthase [Rickettsiales bacterium]|nr:riboflavin synthase [Rickettsiales bacterium]
MFTGIITNLGEVRALNRSENKDLLLTIAVDKISNRKLEIGCSIACNGICLTLIKKQKHNSATLLFFQASKETLDKTTLKNWQIGDLINLEFSLKVGDELGGHMVLGHVDGCAKISKISKIKESFKFIFAPEKKLMSFIAKKGSVTINGTSLTVNEITKNSFSVYLINHTINNTSFKKARIGDLVNIEIDLLARYIANQIQTKF